MSTAGSPQPRQPLGRCPSPRRRGSSPPRLQLCCEPGETTPPGSSSHFGLDFSTGPMAGTVRASSRCGALQVEASLREEQRGGDGVRLSRGCLKEGNGGSSAPPPAQKMQVSTILAKKLGRENPWLSLTPLSSDTTPIWCLLTLWE